MMQNLLNSEDDFRTGCCNVSRSRQQQFFSGKAAFTKHDHIRQTKATHVHDLMSID